MQKTSKYSVFAGKYQFFATFNGYIVKVFYDKKKCSDFVQKMNQELKTN
mgnify:CR=1 FL=1|jgi:hypothetical protein